MPGQGAWWIALLAWFVPGTGHMVLRKWGRAAIMGGAVWVTFFAGLAMGGHMWDLSPDAAVSTSYFDWTTLIQVPPMIGNIGTGIASTVCWLLDIGFGTIRLRQRVQLTNPAPTSDNCGTNELLNDARRF